MKIFNPQLNKNYSLLFLLVLVIGLALNNLAAQTIDPKSVGVFSRADSINTPLNSLRGNGMGFTPNKGQFVDVNKKQCPNILYKGGGGGADVYIRKGGISYVTSDVQKKFREVQAEVELEQVANGKSIYDMKFRSSELLGRMSFNVHRLDVDFIGGNTEYSTVESDQIEGFTNYYLAQCPQGIAKVYSYNRITAKNIYPNIDVVYYGEKQNACRSDRQGLKYDIVVNPNGDPNRIKLNYSGVKEMRVTNEGGLRIETSLSIINEYLPKVYQIINGQVVDVGCKYKLVKSEKPIGNREITSTPNPYSLLANSYSLYTNHYIVSFELGAYNHGLPLIIDPWATYYSGGGASFTIGTASGVAADATGSVLVTGHTATLDFPVSAGAFQLTAGASGGFMDAFLVKFNVSGTRIFGTYFGGNKSDEAYGITADGNDDILISGMTQSTNCPTKNPGGGAYFQSALSGGANADAFVAKFTPAGLLTWATLYGGGGTEEADDVITDGSNNVIIVGKTASTNLPTQAPYQAALSGTSDAFVIKFNSGCVRQWATYYGGAVDESALGVATDGADNIFFTGLTSSTNFPVLTAFQGTFGGIGDAFAVKLNGATGFPLWATYYGGTGNDNACGVAVDALGNCIVVGLTQSTTAIASAGANQMTFAGADDAFIVKFNSAGVRLWGTYHGGVNAEVTGGCAVDSKNNIYWYGEVEDAQPDPSWITTCAYQNTYNGMEDQIISKFTPDGKLTCTTAVGGPGEEDFDGGSVAPHFDIAVSDPYIYIAAHVRQGGYPVTPGAFQTINRAPANGENDAFINQLCMNICQQKFTVTNASANKTVVCINDPITFSSSVNSSCDTTDMRFKWTFTGASPNSSTAANPVVSYASPGYYSVKLVVSTPCQKDSVIKTNYIIVNPCTIKAMATSDTVCSGICTTVIATGSNGKAPYTYSWSTGSTSVTANVCPTTTTVYTVMITDANGNYAATNATVFVYPIMTITSTATNQTCTTNGLASITVSGGTPAYTYTWSSGQTSTTSGYAPGNYTVTVTDALGCTLTKAFNLTSSSPVSASFTYTQACVGQPVVFTNTGSTGTYSWRISPITPANVSGTTNDFSYTFLTAGSYEIFHQVSSGGCLGTQNKIITVINCNAPTIVATGATVCSGKCTSVTSSATGGSGAYTYSWSTGATTQNINPCPTTTTTYTVKVTDSGGNTSTSTAVVTVNPAVTVTATSTNLTCSGTSTGSVTATPAGGTPAFNYVWSNGITTSSGSNLAAGNYTVTVIDSKGCTAVSTTTIVSPPALLGQYTKGTANCSKCGCKEWIMVNAAGGTQPYSYTWPDGYDKRYKNALCPGLYNVIVTDNNGCKTTLNINTP